VANLTSPDKSRHLTPAQEVAVALVVAGKTDGEVAEAAGVTRQTVWEWRRRHPAFIAEVNRRRMEVWEAAVERLRGLLLRAIEVLAEDLDAEDGRLRQQAAVHVLRAAGIYGLPGRPSGPATPEDVERDEAQRAALAKLAVIRWAGTGRPPKL
jgi:hypothetical protein